MGKLLRMEFRWKLISIRIWECDWHCAADLLESMKLWLIQFIFNRFLLILTWWSWKFLEYFHNFSACSMNIWPLVLPSSCPRCKKIPSTGLSRFYGNTQMLLCTVDAGEIIFKFIFCFSVDKRLATAPAVVKLQVKIIYNCWACVCRQPSWSTHWIVIWMFRCFRCLKWIRDMTDSCCCNCRVNYFYYTRVHVNRKSTTIAHVR